MISHSVVKVFVIQAWRPVFEFQHAHKCWICNISVYITSIPVRGWESETREFSEAHGTASMAYIKEKRNSIKNKMESEDPHLKLLSDHHTLTVLHTCMQSNKQYTPRHQTSTYKHT